MRLLRGRQGFIYAGPVYSARDDLEECICPWCIASGEAAARYEAEFTDREGVGGNADRAIGAQVIDEVALRTPGFTGWQQERWLACCSDACEFLGRAGSAEPSGQWAGPAASILEEAGLTGFEGENYLGQLDRDGSPTAYVFRCRHCGRLIGYSDCD